MASMLALAKRGAVLTASMLMGLILGCVHSPDRLPTLDRQFYENLPTEREQRDFLRLRKSQRHGYLVERQLWQQWEALSEEEREAALQRAPRVGYREFTLHMSWGRPADVRVRDADGRSVRFETYIRCTSGPHTGEFVRQSIECDGTASEVTAAVEDGIITELRYLD